MTIFETEKNARRILLWMLVYSLPVFQSMLPVEDPDLWWHLRTGQWILTNGYVPTIDHFSTYGMGKRWIPYSWLFEVVIYGIYSGFGLTGIVAFTVVMSLLIALALHKIVRRAQLPFVLEIVLMASALASMKPLITPRSWLFSILFFAVELLILFDVRRSGRSVYLWLLPPLFVIWANIHLQFIYGLAAIMFLWLEVVFTRLYHSRMEGVRSPSIPIAHLTSAGIACLAAVLVTPYHYQVIYPILDVSTQTGAFSNVLELHPMYFRSPADWFVLLLTLVAAYVLGWRREWMIFPLLLLAMGAFLGFRSRRDVWVVVLTAVATVSEFRIIQSTSEYFVFSRRRILAIAAAVALAGYLIGNHRQITEAQLKNVVAQQFPAKAVDFIIGNRLPGPLFNNFDWGGYLIWRLPALPVSIDNRMNVHGDERIERSLATWSGREGWNKDPELASAQLVVADTRRPLVALLRADRRFKLVYEDGTAAVFVAMTEKS